MLDALARFVVENRYDVRKLIFLITASRIYQTSATPNATNEKDEQNFSRAYFKRPDAEVLLDMICQAIGVPEKFQGSPGITRAVQLWDSKARSDFLKLFGRPSRVSACECERTREPSVSQVLNLLNSPDIQAKLTHEAGTVAKLVRTHKDDAKLVEELYLTFFARFPTADEQRHRREAPEEVRGQPPRRDRRPGVGDAEQHGVFVQPLIVGDSLRESQSLRGASDLPSGANHAPPPRCDDSPGATRGRRPDAADAPGLARSRRTRRFSGRAVPIRASSSSSGVGRRSRICGT